MPTTTTIIAGGGHAGGQTAISLRQAKYEGRVMVCGAEPVPPSGALWDLAQAADLGYVFVHPPYSGHAPIRRYLESGLPLERFYQGGGVTGYRVGTSVDR